MVVVFFIVRTSNRYLSGNNRSIINFSQTFSQAHIGKLT